MSRVLQYLETELDEMRRALSDFEQKHPQKAKSLGISAGRSNDPDIQRLADSVALLAARTTMRLDDAVPEFSLDLMRLMAPSFLYGTPSYCPVILSGEDAIPEPGQIVPAGAVIEFTQPDIGKISYTAARDVTLEPVTISKIGFEHAPFTFGVPKGVHGAESCLVLHISTLDPSAIIGELKLKDLSLFLPADSARRDGLCTALAAHVLGVGVAAPGQFGQTMLPDGTLRYDMAHDTSPFLPGSLAQSQGVERLRDFLAYPDKAYFFTLTDLGAAFVGQTGRTAELRIFLDASSSQSLNAPEFGDLVTNAVPCINVFEDRSLPTRYESSRDSVPVTPFLAQDGPVEILAVTEIKELTPDGEVTLPELSTPARRVSQDRVLWQERFSIATQDPARRLVSFSVPEGAKGALDEVIIDFIAGLLCSNGSAGGAPRLGAKGRFNSGDVASFDFSILNEPSASQDPEISAARRWDLLSLLHGNYASIFSADDPAAALRELINLCAPGGLSDAATAIWEVNCSQSIAPITIAGNVLLSAGTKIEVVLNSDALPMSTISLGHALNDLFSSFVSYDRFFQLSLRERGKINPFLEFPKRHGAQICP